MMCHYYVLQKIASGVFNCLRSVSVDVSRTQAMPLILHQVNTTIITVSKFSLKFPSLKRLITKIVKGLGLVQSNPMH